MHNHCPLFASGDCRQVWRLRRRDNQMRMLFLVRQARSRPAQFACAQSEKTRDGFGRRNAPRHITSTMIVGSIMFTQKKNALGERCSCEFPVPYAGTCRSRLLISCSRAVWHLLDVPSVYERSRPTLLSHCVATVSASTA